MLLCGVDGNQIQEEKRVNEFLFLFHLPLLLQIILVLKSLQLFDANTDFNVALQVTSHVLAYCSSCINPVLYAFLSENFRKAFRKVSKSINERPANL